VSKYSTRNGDLGDIYAICRIVQKNETLPVSFLPNKLTETQEKGAVFFVAGGLCAFVHTVVTHYKL
jgi:hypothetical protein